MDPCLRPRIGFGRSDSVLKLGVAAQQGNSRYFLPDGYGILSDPTDIRFSQKRIEPRLEVSKTVVRFPDLKLDLRAGIGYEITQLKTSIQSALLDIRTTQFVQEPVVTLGAKITTDGRSGILPLAIGVTARKVGQHPASYGAQIGVDF